MSLIRVGILRGGTSNEYEVSLKTGATILNHIPKEKYRPIDIYIDTFGIWHVQGVRSSMTEALSKIDVAVNALHGEFGEDGKIQGILDKHHVPYTGSGAFASAIGMNKVMSKEMFKRHGLKTPYHVVFDKEEHAGSKMDKAIHDMATFVFTKFPVPAVIKPATSGSSLGISIAHSMDEIVAGLTEAFKHSRTVLVEELVRGTEATVGVIEGYRDEELYALPPIEIRPPKGKFFTYQGKYAGESAEIIPGNFTTEQKKELEELARVAHRSLGLRHYSRSDFIVTPRRGIYILEVNTLPGLTDESLVPKAIRAVGGTLSHFIDHLIELAMAKK